MKIIKTHIILYVKNQLNSSLFYQKILRTQPTLEVNGMTEFQLSETTILGLMPEKNIEKIINKLPKPSSANGIPRCELYFYVDDVETAYHYAIQVGANLISDLQERNWGDKACYFSDLDGNVIAFAEKM